MISRIRDLFSPKELQSLDMTQLLALLGDPAVRRHWLGEVYDELKRMNLKIDELLETEAPRDKFVEASAKRRQLEWVLRQIEGSRTSVELEQGHNSVSGAVLPAPDR